MNNYSLSICYVPGTVLNKSQARMNIDPAVNNTYILEWEYRPPFPHPSNTQINKLEVWIVKDATQCISCSLSFTKGVIKVQMVWIYL